MNGGLLDLGPALRHEPLDLQIAWEKKEVASRVPQPSQHDEWRLVLDLVCPNPILLALVIKTPSELRFGRVHRSHAASEVRSWLAFIPFDWAQSDDVDIALLHSSGTTVRSHGVRIRVRSPQIKSDPVSASKVPLLRQGASITTGSVVLVAEIPEARVVAEMAILDKGDTKRSSHGRWRIKSELAEDLPPDYRFLVASGNVFGVLTR